MKQNQYYNKHTMNLKQLSRDLEKTGFTCKLSEDGDYLCVYYLCFLDYVEISLTFYNVAANWAVIKLLNKLLTEV